MKSVFLATESIKHTGASFTTPFSSKENADLFIDYRQKSGDFDNSIFYKECLLDTCYVRVYKDEAGFAVSVLWCRPKEDKGTVTEEGESIFATLEWNVEEENIESVLDRGTVLIQEHLRIRDGEGVFFAILQTFTDSGEIQPFPFIYTTEAEAYSVLNHYSNLYSGVYSVVSGLLEIRDSITHMVLLEPFPTRDGNLLEFPILVKRG